MRSHRWRVDVETASAQVDVGRQGFSLIELVIVLAILGILATIVIPRYLDMSGDARASSARYILGATRSAIQQFGMDALLSSGHHTLPTTLQLRGYSDRGPEASSQVVRGRFPENPYFIGVPGDDWKANRVRTTADTKGSVASPTDYGWAYNATTGQFWANSSVTGENAW